MQEGTIKKITDRGFGFIRTSTGEDLFFHMSSVEVVSFDELREGQRVSYVEGMGPKGSRAESVSPL
jgi:CspA family cold shock protein